MPRRVYECTTYDTATGTCTVAAWVERSDFPALSVADAFILLSAITVVFVQAWGWRQIGWSIKRG